MMVLIDRKFNEEQLLFETFFPKMHIERDICKKVISRGVKTFILKKLQEGGAGILICYSGHHSQTFSALKLSSAHFVIFPLILISFA